MKVPEIIHGIWYQNPHFQTVTTMSDCRCGLPARGGGPCTACLHAKLSLAVGPDAAWEFVECVRKIRRLEASFAEV